MLDCARRYYILKTLCRGCVEYGSCTAESDYCMSEEYYREGCLLKKGYNISELEDRWEKDVEIINGIMKLLGEDVRLDEIVPAIKEKIEIKKSALLEKIATSCFMETFASGKFKDTTTTPELTRLALTYAKTLIEELDK